MPDLGARPLLGNFSSASDIWALGIVIWELCSFCEVPYPAMGNGEVFAAISKGYRLPKPAICPAAIHYLCLQCWYVTFRLNFHHFDRCELDLRGNTQP